MPTYIYEALNEDGLVVRGAFDADNRLLALNHLKQYRFKIRNLREQTAFQRFLNRLRGVRLSSLVVFTRQLATMVKAGIPIMRCFDLLSSEGENPRFENYILLVKEQIKTGGSLSGSLSKYPEVFDPVYLSLVRAGEVSGEMPEILERVATYLEKTLNLKTRIRSSLTYPILIFIFCVSIAFFLIIYIFPRFMGLFEGFHLKLPLPTRILILTVDLFRNPIFDLLLIGGICAGGFLFSQYVKTYIGRKHFHHWLISIPVLGPINQKIAVSRFCRTFATLFGSGVPIMQSLEIVSNVTGNEIVNEAISQVQEAVKYGSTISAPLEESGFFPRMVVDMIQVGEKTGYLHRMLEKIADYYDLEVELALLNFTKLLEPVLIGFMGGIVGFLILSIFMPIYELIGNFGR